MTSDSGAGAAGAARRLVLASARLGGRDGRRRRGVCGRHRGDRRGRLSLGCRRNRSGRSRGGAPALCGSPVPAGKMSSCEPNGSTGNGPDGRRLPRVRSRLCPGLEAARQRFVEKRAGRSGGTAARGAGVAASGAGDGRGGPLRVARRGRCGGGRRRRRRAATRRRRAGVPLRPARRGGPLLAAAGGRRAISVRPRHGGGRARR